MTVRQVGQIEQGNSSGSAEATPSTGTTVSVQPPVTGNPEPFLEHFSISPALEARVLAAETAAVLQGTLPPELEHLVSRLRGEDRVWGSRARLARAFKAGLQARARLEGVIVGEGVPAVPFRNSQYVVLRCEQYPFGFWTGSYPIYIREVGRGATGGDQFARNSVSHAFASLTEIEAFLAGARRPWPPQLR